MPYKNTIWQHTNFTYMVAKRHNPPATLRLKNGILTNVSHEENKLNQIIDHGHPKFPQVHVITYKIPKTTILTWVGIFQRETPRFPRTNNRTIIPIKFKICKNSHRCGFRTWLNQGDARWLPELSNLRGWQGRRPLCYFLCAGGRRLDGLSCDDYRVGRRSERLASTNEETKVPELHRLQGRH